MIDNDKVLHLGEQLAAPFEGLSLTAYHDPVGFPTIGYGHLLTRKRYAPLDEFQPITKADAASLLQQDMTHALHAVLRLVTVPLTNPQAAALADFTFNCGAGNLQASTLLRLLNRGQYDSVPDQLNRWVYAAGVKLSGLVIRRQAEGALWLSN